MILIIYTIGVILYFAWIMVVTLDAPIDESSYRWIWCCVVISLAWPAVVVGIAAYSICSWIDKH